MNFEQIAEKIYNDELVVPDINHKSDDELDALIVKRIADLLRDEFGRTIEAAHLFLDDSFAGCTMQTDNSAYVVNLAKQLNRYHDNGDSTGTIKERGE